MSSIMYVIPSLVMVILWLAVVVYVFLLATRFVNAVEQIARAMAQRLPDSLEP